MRGFFEIGVYHPKTEMNIGSLWRSAYQLGAAGIFTIGRRYKTQSSDTLKTDRHIPLRHFDTFQSFKESMPHGAPLCAIEMGGKPLGSVRHDERAIYLLGAEDHGLPPEILAQCHRVISLESIRTQSFNVAVAGALVMYDRMIQQKVR